MSAQIEDLPRSPAQRRILTVLVAAQVLSGVGPAASATVVALIAQDVLGFASLVGLPSALVTAGSALAAAVVGRICQARGRRLGLAVGYLSGAIGSAGVIAAATIGSPALLFLALFVFGAGMSTNLQARYAGADLAAPDHRARAVATVLIATTLGGVVGPNLAAPFGDLAHTVGIPQLVGPFLLAGAAYTMAAMVLAIWLRPDPLLLARAVAAENTAAVDAPPRDANGRPHPAALRHRPVVLVGALVMALAQLVVYPIMLMTPVHMHGHGHGTAATGLVIAIHISAMFLPSLVTGWLVDRFGRLTIAASSGMILLTAGIIAASASGTSVAPLAVALALLGLGWNFAMVSGTAIITDAVPLATRAKTQGLVDVAIAIAAAIGAVVSGFVVSAAGFPTLALAGGLIALAVLPVIATIRNR